MTGSVMVLMASASLKSNTFNSNFANTSISTPGTYTAQLSFATDGTTTGSHASSTSSWFSPTTAGIGSSFWVKATTASGTNLTFFGGISTSSWTQLTGAASFGAQNSTTSSEGIGNYVVSFATDSAGGNIVGTVSGSIDVGYAP